MLHCLAFVMGFGFESDAIGGNERISHYCHRYYSMYGHVEKLAQEIRKGAASVEGVEAKLWQVSLLPAL